MEQMIVCPHCGEQLKILVSGDGRIEAVLFDIPLNFEEPENTTEKMGYCFGEMEGGEKELES